MREATRERISKEGAERDRDVSLIERLEETQGLRDWEKNLLENASLRVFKNRRSLLAGHRAELEEVDSRRNNNAGDI